jgi:hypothetical protein
MSDHCKNSHWVTFFNKATGQTVTVHVPCKTWGCVACAPLRRADWERTIIENMSHAPSWLWTITITRADWRTRVYPQITRATEEADTPKRYIVFEQAHGMCTVFATVPIAGAECLRRPFALKAMLALVRVQDKNGCTRPIHTSRYWGPKTLETAAEPEYAYLGCGAGPRDVVNAVNSVLRKAKVKTIESCGKGGVSTVSLSHLRKTLLGKAVTAIGKVCKCAYFAISELGGRTSARAVATSKKILESERIRVANETLATC